MADRPRSVVQALLAAGRAVAGRRRTKAGAARAAADFSSRFRIERELGRGSMGVVYLAHDATTGGRVALKTFALAHDLAGDDLHDARARFLREAEAARRLRHPGIVAVLDAGGDGAQAWIAMEYVAGSPLTQHADAAHRLPVPQVLLLATQVAHALAHAHGLGIVHRDIKPANLIFDPVGDRVKVADFGTAHLADASRTRTGMVVGTPSYMAPEQLAGGPVDARSDVYALGVTLFQLLGGCLPHSGESMAQLLYRIANEPAPDIRSLRPELPEALANVVALALEKRPELRYGSALEMAGDLEVLAGRPASGAAQEADRAAHPFTQSGAPGPSDTRHNSRN